MEVEKPHRCMESYDYHYQTCAPGKFDQFMSLAKSAWSQPLPSMSLTEPNETVSRLLVEEEATIRIGQRVKAGEVVRNFETVPTPKIAVKTPWLLRIPCLLDENRAAEPLHVPTVEEMLREAGYVHMMREEIYNRTIGTWANTWADHLNYLARRPGSYRSLMRLNRTTEWSNTAEQHARDDDRDACAPEPAGHMNGNQDGEPSAKEPEGLKHSEEQEDSVRQSASDKRVALQIFAHEVKSLPPREHLAGLMRCSYDEMSEANSSHGNWYFPRSGPLFARVDFGGSKQISHFLVSLLETN